MTPQTASLAQQNKARLAPLRAAMYDFSQAGVRECVQGLGLVSVLVDVNIDTL